MQSDHSTDKRMQRQMGGWSWGQASILNPNPNCKVNFQKCCSPFQFTSVSVKLDENDAMEIQNF